MRDGPRRAAAVAACVEDEYGKSTPVCEIVIHEFLEIGAGEVILSLPRARHNRLLCSSRPKQGEGAFSKDWGVSLLVFRVSLF